MGGIFAFFQSLGTSHYFRPLSGMIEWPCRDICQLLSLTLLCAISSEYKGENAL